MPLRILFYPEAPSQSTTARILCDVLGYVRTSDPNDGFHAAIKWHDNTVVGEEQLSGVGCSRASVINGFCVDTSKQTVGRVFDETFGYALNLDPAEYAGDAVSRSDTQAAHDGRVMKCPMAADSVDKRRVYQRLIDNRIDDHLVRGYRIPVCGSDIPFVYCNDREISQRFQTDCVRSELTEVNRVLSISEQRSVLRFCCGIGLEFGELDVLRDRDERIYVVDASSTPCEPPRALDQEYRWQAMLRLAGSFSELVRKRAKRESLSIVILQSCDESYFDLLDITSDANSVYASRHGYSYWAEVGNLGPVPRTGNWNRYFLLRQEIDRGVHDWAFWMDADAVVRDPRITLESIIDRTPDKMLIACNGGNRGDHDINNGVFLLNLRHALARRLVDYAIECCQRLDPEIGGFRNDQPHMHRWLCQHYDGKEQISFVERYSGREHDLFNYDGDFVCHVLREYGTHNKRRNKLKRVAARSLAASRTADVNTDSNSRSSLDS